MLQREYVTVQLCDCEHGASAINLSIDNDEKIRYDTMALIMTERKR